MKRGTPSHPKTLALAKDLNLERWGAVGILESLWHWAGQYARRGDVGRFSDQDIANGIGWSGDASALVEALQSNGWLDKCECHRLRIHGWPEHADQAVNKTSEVKRSGFLECYVLPEGVRKTSGSPPEASSDHPEGVNPLPAKADGTGHRADGTGQTAQGRRTDALAPAAPCWSREACDDWIARLGGTAPGGPIGKALKPLVSAHGWAEVRVAWRSYLEQVDAEFASAPRFAATYGRWSGSAREPPKRGPAQTTGDGLKRIYSGVLEDIEAKQARRGTGA